MLLFLLVNSWRLLHRMLCLRPTARAKSKNLPFCYTYLIEERLVYLRFFIARRAKCLHCRPNLWEFFFGFL